VPKILPSGGQRWHAPVVKLGAQFVRLGGDDGEAADQGELLLLTGQAIW